MRLFAINPCLFAVACCLLLGGLATSSRAGVPASARIIHANVVVVNQQPQAQQMPGEQTGGQQAQQQQQEEQPPEPRPGKPEWKGDRVGPTQKPITQWFVTFFVIVGILFVITRTARRAHGD